MIGIRVLVLKYTYILTGITRKLVKSGVNKNWKGYVVKAFSVGSLTIHSREQTICSPPQNITMQMK